MDYKYIEQLLERYWKCETSLQEESILRNFFAQHDVPSHLMPYKGLFLCEENIREAHLSEDFDKRILALTEQKETHVALAVKVRKASLNYRLQPFFKAAAVVAIVLSLSMAVQMAMEQEQGQTLHRLDMIETKYRQAGKDIPREIEHKRAYVTR